MMGVYGALGDLRLLRDADRLERRDRPRARAAVRRPARRGAAAPLPRDRGSPRARTADRGISRDPHPGAAAARTGAPRRGDGARALAAVVAAVSRGPCLARGRASARLEACDP